MSSVLNLARSNSMGLFLTSGNVQRLSYGNKFCWNMLPKKSFRSVHVSSAYFTTPLPLTNSFAKQSIIRNPADNQLQSRNMSVAHSHSNFWKAERYLSAGLVGIIPLALVYPNPALDYALALALTVHVHWGVEAIVVDYLRPSVVGATLSKVAVATVHVLSVLTLGGLFYFNYSDVGLSQAIRMLWKL